MSRVFEALSRAGEEKHRQVQPPVEKIETIVTAEMLVEEKGSTIEQLSKANSAISKTNGAAYEAREFHSVVTNGEKTWRDKIEEWFLGWGLGRYNGYPI